MSTRSKKIPIHKAMETITGLHIAVLIISGLILMLLLFYLFKTRNKQVEIPKVEKPVSNRHCPLCGEPLVSGERVHSVLYPGKPDSMMEIYGCPYCEKPDAKNKRRCPVCKKELPSDAVIIARVFEKPGKKHVHVLGCTLCYSGRSVIKH